MPTSDGRPGVHPVVIHPQALVVGNGGRVGLVDHRLDGHCSLYVTFTGPCGGDSRHGSERPVHVRGAAQATPELS
jgi:hypothetical protein